MHIKKAASMEITVSRRRFLSGLSALGAGALVPGCAPISFGTDTMPEIERNKAIALRFKNAQGQPDGEAVIGQVLASDYKRTRDGMEHLAANAQGQGFPSPGPYLRTAIPDRVDVIEQVIAEDDKVGLLFRLTGTHKANLFGIPATGQIGRAHV